MNNKLLSQYKSIGVFVAIVVLIFTLGAGWKSHHVVLILLMLGLGAIPCYGARIVLGLSGFIIFFVLYESLQVLPNYSLQAVHVEDLYLWEKSWFGVWDGDRKVILCEWLADRKHDALSIFGGVSYLLWMPMPIAYTLLLIFTKKYYLAITYSYAFLLTCLIGFVGYYAYPAAPPWYYLTYGAVFDSATGGSAALLTDFDRIIGVPLFVGIYEKGSNVFCAVPSLHAAYPVITLYYAYKEGFTWKIPVFIVWGIGTWFAAVYSQHHYLIDVLLGLFCALLAGWIMDQIAKTQRYKNFVEWMRKLMIG